MQTLTATQASRGFAALLDLVAKGETVIITRDGQPIARLEPEHQATGALALALFAKPTGDPEFADDLEAAHNHMRAQPMRISDGDA